MVAGWVVGTRLQLPGHNENSRRTIDTHKYPHKWICLPGSGVVSFNYNFQRLATNWIDLNFIDSIWNDFRLFAIFFAIGLTFLLPWRQNKITVCVIVCSGRNKKTFGKIVVLTFWLMCSLGSLFLSTHSLMTLLKNWWVCSVHEVSKKYIMDVGNIHPHSKFNF